MPAILVVLVVIVLASGCSSLPQVYDFHDPLTPAEHLALGVSYESDGNADLAIAEYKKVTERDNNYQGVLARVFLGNVYAGLEQYSVAEQYYRKALSLDPRQSQALNNLAALYVKQSIKLGEAEDLARAAVTEAEREHNAGQTGVCLETLGEVLLQEGHYSEALENFRKAETFSETGKTYWLAQLYLNMADAYEKLGQRVEAQQARQRADGLQ